MTATVLLPVPIFRAFDSAGDPLAGGLLYTYLANTATPATTWSDYAGSSPNTNPVVLDTTGTATVRLDPTVVYKFVLKDSGGATQWTADYYSGFSASGIGAALYPISAAETSAGITPTAYNYAHGDVRRYGVTGDGTTDDTTTINNALKVGYYGTTIFFQPSMTCIVTNIAISLANVNIPPQILGNGATLKAKAGSSGILVYIENAHQKWDNFKFTKFTLNGNNLSTTGLEVHGSQHQAEYSELNIGGIALGTGVLGQGVGLYLHSEPSYGIYYNRFERIQCGFDSSGGDPALGACGKYGFYEYGPGPQFRCNANVFINCYARDNANAGWYMDYAQNTHVNCAAELNHSYGVVIDNTSGTSWYGGYLEVNNGTAALTFTGAFAGGETSGTLTTAWNAATSASQYSVTFSNGDIRTVALTNGATTATWSGALSGAATANATITTVDLHVTANAGGVWWQADRIVVVCDGADNANWQVSGMNFMGRGSNTPWHDMNGLFSVRSLKLRSTGIGIANNSVPANGINGSNSQDFLIQVGASTKLKWAQASGLMESVVGHQFDKAAIDKRVTITYSASMTPDASAGNHQEITANNGTAFTINAPTNPVDGQRMSIKIRNTSGGALGVVTWDAVFKQAAWTSPATANSRTNCWDYNGTNWVQAFQSAADVPN